MRQLSISSDMYRKMLLDAGAVYTDFNNPGSPGACIGATRGGASFTRTPEYATTPYEGITHPVIGERHLVSVRATLEVNIITFDTGNLLNAFPNSSLTPPSGGFAQITESEWDAFNVHSLTNIAILAQLAGENNPVCIVLDNPIAEKDFNFSFKDKNEVVSKWTFSAYYDEIVGFTDPPWRIYWPQNDV